MRVQSAFPVQDAYSVSTDRGMTLRDYFAAKAMQAMLTKDTLMLLGNRGVTMLEVADRAYEMADAMMEARNAAQ